MEDKKLYTVADLMEAYRKGFDDGFEKGKACKTINYPSTSPVTPINPGINDPWNPLNPRITWWDGSYCNTSVFKNDDNQHVTLYGKTAADSMADFASAGIGCMAK